MKGGVFLINYISDFSWCVSEGHFCWDKTLYRWDKGVPHSDVWSRCALKDSVSKHSHIRTGHNAILENLFHLFLGKHKPQLQLKDLLSGFKSGLISVFSWHVSEGRFCWDKILYRWDKSVPHSSAWSRCASKDCFSKHSHTHTRHNAILENLFHWFLEKHKPQLQLKGFMRFNQWYLLTCFWRAFLLGQNLEQMGQL